MSSRRSIPTVDRISALTDSLLCHTLSFLPTKVAVATSVLSKRWRPLWKSVMSLDFDDQHFKDFNSFCHFVYSVIFSQDPKLSLRSFRIRCGQSNNFNPRDLDQFIHAAVQRQIEIFDLHVHDKKLSYDAKEYVPGIPSVLSCRTLVVLKLAHLKVHSIPVMIDLPLLKTLHLASVAFQTPFAHFMNFVRGCSLVEDLHISDVDTPDRSIDQTREFQGFPKLVRAYIHSCDEVSFPFVWLHNAKFMDVGLRPFRDYQIPTFPNLTHMELFFEYVSDVSWPGKWDLVQQVLHHCPVLQSLIIDDDSDGHAIEDEDSKDPEDWKDSESEDEDEDEDEDSAYTKREKIIEDEDWKYPGNVPECLSSHLRKCCLRNFNRHPSQLEFVEYIMFHSDQLSNMTIQSDYWLDEIAQEELMGACSHRLDVLDVIF